MNQLNTVIFDVAGVLFKENKLKLLAKVGIWDTLYYVLAYRKNPLNTCFKALTHISNSSDSDPKTIRLYYKENKLPACITYWQKGEMSGNQILTTLNADIDNLDKCHFFKSGYEKKLVKKLLRLYIDPLECQNAFEPVAELHSLVHTLKSKGYKLYILSNQAEETFSMLESQHRNFFDSFDGISVSARAHMVKPDPAFYSQLLNSYAIAP